MTIRMYAIWDDANGVSRQTVLNSTAGALAAITAVTAVSNARVLYYVESALSTPIGVAVTNPYQSVKSSATLYFQTGVGTIVRVTVVAPQLSLFLADQQTVDPVAAAPLIAAVVGSVTDVAGNVVTSYLGGLLDPGRNDLPPTGP